MLVYGHEFGPVLYRAGRRPHRGFGKKAPSGSGERFVGSVAFSHARCRKALDGIGESVPGAGQAESGLHLFWESRFIRFGRDPPPVVILAAVPAFGRDYPPTVRAKVLSAVYSRSG